MLCGRTDSAALRIYRVSFLKNARSVASGRACGYFYDLTGDYTLSYANAVFAGIINLTILSSLAFYRSRNRPALAA